MTPSPAGSGGWFWLPVCLGGLAIVGACIGWALGAAAVGESPKNGFLTMGVGLFATGIGRLATAWLRFTRKIPKPLPGSDKVQRSMRANIIADWITCGLIVAGCVLLVLFAPRSGAPTVVALYPMMAAIPLVVLLGLYRIRRIMRSRTELYVRWLAKNHPGRNEMGDAQ